MIVVVDIETTGLVPEECVILEVGVILCNDDLEEKGAFKQVIRYGSLNENTLEPVVYEMHSQSGLLELVAKSPFGYKDVERNLVDFLTDQNATGQPMCGSSVHFDRSFLKVWMPAVENLFSYRNIDVSTIKGLCERWAPRIFDKRPTGRKLHRSIPDCEDTIEELKFYKENLIVPF